jgi:hypothetical protein
MQVQFPWSKVEFFLSENFPSYESIGFCGECLRVFVGCNFVFSYVMQLCLLLSLLVFFWNPWFGPKVLPPVWIFALKLWPQWSCRTAHALYLCYVPPCFRWPSYDGVFCPCGWWCVEMYVFLLTVRSFQLWLWCGCILKRCCSSLFPVGYTWFIRAMPPFFCCCFPRIWRDRPVLFGF